jgi:hypothetical protein
MSSLLSWEVAAARARELRSMELADRHPSARLVLARLRAPRKPR